MADHWEGNHDVADRWEGNHGLAIGLAAHSLIALRPSLHQPPHPLPPISPPRIAPQPSLIVLSNPPPPPISPSPDPHFATLLVSLLRLPSSTLLPAPPFAPFSHQAALGWFNIANEIQDGLWQTLAALLYLGNVVLDENADDSDKVRCGARVSFLSELVRLAHAARVRFTCACGMHASAVYMRLRFACVCGLHASAVCMAFTLLTMLSYTNQAIPFSLHYTLPVDAQRVACATPRDGGGLARRHQLDREHS